MPRPKKDGAAEPKKRSRHGCWPCKSRKIKCGEEKPECLNCVRQGEKCDYSIRLNWEGRGKKKGDSPTPNSATLSWTSNSSTRPGPSSAASQASQAGSPLSMPATPGSSVMSSVQTMSPQMQVATPQSQTMQAQYYSPPTYASPQLGQRNLIAPQPLPSYSPNLLQPTSSPYMMAPNTYQNQAPAYSATLPASRGSPMTAVPAHLRNHHSELAQHDDSHRSKRVRMTEANGDEASFADPFHENQIIPGYQSINSLPHIHHLSVAVPPLSPSSTPVPNPQQQQEGRLSIDMPARKSSSSDEPRKLSVQSLLSSPPDDKPVPAYAEYKTCGYDTGRPDIDIPKNDDNNALTWPSPTFSVRHIEFHNLPEMDTPQSSHGFGFGVQPRNPHFEQQSYYAEPVPVRVPLNLEPLPDMLNQPMNLLYFHHFLNHTAKILVPHDCPDNPFRNILPRLAMNNMHLLNLLLAYSASHRARLLKHAEPVIRIAEWMKPVFPALRFALQDSKEQISDANLAAAILLASLEIISPSAFEVEIPWQNHLSIAREMIIMRGGYKSISRNDKTSYFLVRWFAYLDVMGSLSGSIYYDRPLSGVYEIFGGNNDSEPDGEAINDVEIDCLLGFTTRCISILARVADLAKQCDLQRVKQEVAEDGSTIARIDTSWHPSDSVRSEAEYLRRALSAPPAVKFKGCSHQRHGSETLPSGRRDSNLVDYAEMVATNEAFHQAGLIHLHRRVLNEPSTSFAVQNSVRAIVAVLQGKICDGGTAEACILFPMFTAGCEAREQEQRNTVLKRLHSVEGMGMAQAKKARTLMERVWETGKNWETLVKGEFVG